MSSPALFAAPLEVDRVSLLELARGGNLYADRFAFLRELLQNAVDATLLRLFVERGIGAFPTHERSMTDLRTALAGFPIDVTIATLEDDRSGPEPMRRYRVRIEDRGLGIALTDIPHLQRIASSSKNPARAALIAAMPEWMRPSGAFGIGLQSAFLVADQLVLDTRTMDGDARKIVLRANDGGSIEVHESERTVVGTCAELVVRVPARWHSLRAVDHVAEQQHDMVRDGWFDEQLSSARGLARQLGAGGHVPVRVDDVAVPFLFDGDRARFDPTTGVEIVLPVDDGEVVPISAEAGTNEQFQNQFSRLGASRMVPPTYYRGAPAHLGIREALSVVLPTNIHFGAARQLLELGRDRFVAGLDSDVGERIHGAVRRFGLAHLETLRARGASDTLRCRTALLLHSCGATETGDEWRLLVVAKRADDTPVALGELVDEGSLLVIDESIEARLKRRDMAARRFILASGETLRSISEARDQRIREFLPGLVADTDLRSTWRLQRGLHVTTGRFLEELPASTAMLRPLLILPDELLTLAVANSDRRPWNWPVTASPWTFANGVVEVPEPLRWIDFVIANAATPGGSPDEVARALVRLLRLGDPVLRQRPNLNVRYDLDSVIAEIAARHPGARE